MNKLLLTVPIMVFVLVYMASFGLAATKFVTPAIGSNLSSAISLAVNYVNVTDVTNPIAANTTLYYSTDSGATWSTATFTSFAQNGSQVTGTLAISAIADNADVDLNMTIGNATALAYMASANTTTNLRIDDTAPTLKVEPRDSISYGSLIEYRCYDNLEDQVAANVTVTHPSGDSPASTLLTGDDASTDPMRTFADTDMKGNFVFTCTDYALGNAATSITVTAQELGGHQAYIPADTGSQNNTKTILLVIGGIVLVYFLTKKK